MKLTNNTIKKTMNILEERKTVKENFSRMDALQGSNAMEKAFAAVDLSTLMGIARPYLNDDEKEILKDEMLKIVMVLPDAELAEIYDTVVASVKGQVSEEESVDEVRYDPGMSFAEKVRKRLGMVTKADRQKAKERQDAQIAKDYGPTPASAKTNSKFKDHGGDMAKKIASKPQRGLDQVDKDIEDRRKRDRKKRKEQERLNSKDYLRNIGKI